MSSEIVTRFPPSPTGMLHIGGVRTALFNWLFARHHGGKFLLRIEDTDRERSTEAAKTAIIDGLNWLGLDHDGEIVLQSQRSDRHRACAEQLLANGKAYRCYATPQELEEMRSAALAAGRPPIYSGLWRDRPASDAPDGQPYAVRLKAPQTGVSTLADRVQGDVTVSADALDDLILLRSDGTPTYMLAVVVDDHDMGVTHVIRGDDHLNNAHRQNMIYDALGWPRPIYAHIPLIHGEDGAKLSKRHGALGVESYHEMGLLPEAILTTLLRLGWSHGNQEEFTLAEAIDLFSLEAVGKSPARLDFEKFRHNNAKVMQRQQPAEIMAALEPFLQNALNRELKTKEPEAFFDQMETSDQIKNATKQDSSARNFDQAEKQAAPNIKRVADGLALLLPRAHTLVELAEEALCLALERPLNYHHDEISGLLAKAPDPALCKTSSLTSTSSKSGGLRAIKDTIAALDWDAPDCPATLQTALKALAKELGVKMGALGMPLRAAVTARAATPSVFEICALLGREETLLRLEDACQYLERINET